MSNINKYGGNMKGKLNAIIAGTMLAITSAMPASATVLNTNAQHLTGEQSSLLLDNPEANLIAQGTPAAAASPAAAGGELAIEAAKLATEIHDLVKASQNRGGFVKGMMEKASFAAGGKYNVMVFNMSQPYSKDLRGIKFVTQENYDGVP